MASISLKKFDDLENLGLVYVHHSTAAAASSPTPSSQQAAQQPTAPLEDFLCPIGLDVMVDPGCFINIKI